MTSEDLSFSVQGSGLSINNFFDPELDVSSHDFFGHFLTFSIILVKQ